jgi:hypothetical protein
MYRIILMTMLVGPWALALVAVLGHALVDRVARQLRQEKPASARLSWRGREVARESPARRSTLILVAMR